MGLKNGMLLVFVLTQIFVFAQDSLSVNCKLMFEYPKRANATWELDAIENVYMCSEGVIDKYDSLGNLRFSQSIKSLGKPDQVAVINTMKLVAFSEEQQSICLFDNTLTKTIDCIDLGELNFLNIKTIAVSSRPQLLWLLDKVNSKLTLLNIQNSSVLLELENLAGMLDAENIIQIKENDNLLYLLDNKKGVYVFDMYGSLIDLFQFEGGEFMSLAGNSLLILKQDVIHVIDQVSLDHQVFACPVLNVDHFEIRGNSFFASDNENVYKFRIQIEK
jgi:hypothetical protein